MPIPLHSRETIHPFFYTPQKTLLSLAGQWSAGKLTDVESYLLYLSLLNSTELVEFRVAAKYSDEQTPKIIHNNMEFLLKIVGKVNLIKHPSFSLPKFVITPDTADLKNSYYWIQAWVGAHKEFMDGYTTAADTYEQEVRERALERLIKSPHKTVENYAETLANWAEKACVFPHFLIKLPKSGREVPISAYWKLIIKTCATDSAIFNVPREDLEELIEHCEDNIEPGSIYSNALMRLLRSGHQKRTNFMGFGDVDIASKRSTEFTILDDESSVEVANIQSAIHSAPESVPKPDQYPSKFAYIKAKMNYDLAQKRRNDVS
jgi:hypothetical protein